MLVAKKLSAEQQEELVKKINRFEQDGVSGNDEWRTRAKKGRAFYAGGDGQWDPTVLAELRAAGKPVLTINMILPIVNFLCGVQKQNRRDIKILARRDGTDAAARVLTHLIKHTNSESHADYQLSKVFEDGAKTGKGWIEIERDYQADPFDGDSKTVRDEPLDIIEDPTATAYDLNHPTQGAMYIIKRSWVDKNYLRKKYPDAAELLGKPGASDAMADVGDIEAIADDLYVDEVSEDEEEAIVERARYRVRVRDCWWRKFENVTMVKDKQQKKTMKLYPEKEAEKIAAAKKLAELDPDRFIIRENCAVVVMCRTKIVGKAVLEHKESPFDGAGIYPFFRFCPYWEEGHVFGVIDNLIGPQEEKNKRRSQFLSILNQTASGGWMYKINTLGTEMLKKLKRFGAMPGFNIEYKGEKPERIGPPNVSKGHKLAEDSASEDMKEISGVNAANMGMDARRDESGRLNELKQRQGMTVSEIIFDNFDYTVRLYAVGLCNIIMSTNIYSDEEIGKIIDENEMLDPDILKRTAREMMEEVKPPSPPQEPQPPEAPDPQAMGQLMDVDQRRVQNAYLVAMEGFKAKAQKFQTEMQQYERVAEKYKQVIKRATIAKVLEQVRDYETKRYGAEVAQAQSTPTVQVANYNELLAITEKFPGLIKPELLVKASGLSKGIKEEVLSSIKEQTAAAAQAAA